MKTILNVLKEYKVEIDSDCNNLENIDVVRTHVDAGLYFVYKLLSSYKHMDKHQDLDLRGEVLLVGIEAERIACKLLSNYVRLRLMDLDKAYLSLSTEILDKVRELAVEFKSRAVYRETIITPEYFVSKGGFFSIERLVNDCEIIIKEYY